MRTVQQWERDAIDWWNGKLSAHRWRVENWNDSASLREAWTPEGLTCPACRADHCEVDGHFCAVKP
jgi:hypothetical protein